MGDPIAALAVRTTTRASAVLMLGGMSLISASTGARGLSSAATMAAAVALRSTAAPGRAGVRLTRVPVMSIDGSCAGVSKLSATPAICFSSAASSTLITAGKSLLPATPPRSASGLSVRPNAGATEATASIVSPASVGLMVAMWLGRRTRIRLVTMPASPDSTAAAASSRVMPPMSTPCTVLPGRAWSPEVT